MKFFVNTLFIGFSLLTIACGTSKKESRSNTNTASNDISVDLSQAFNNENDFGLVKGIESERLYMLIDQNQKVYMTMECKNEDAPKSIASYYLSYNLKKLKDVLKNGDDFVLRLTSPAGTEAHPDYQCEVSVRLEHAYEGFKRAEPIFIAQTTFAKATKKLNYQLSDKLKEKMETLPMLVKVQSVQGNRAQLSDVVGSNSGLDLYAYCHNPTSDSKHYEFAMYVKKGLTLDEFLNGSDGIKLDYIWISCSS